MKTFTNNLLASVGLAALSTAFLGITVQSSSASTITNNSAAGTLYTIVGQAQELIGMAGVSGIYATSIVENYGETYLIPSSGGSDIVGIDGTNPLYFDKTLTITNFDQVVPPATPDGAVCDPLEFPVSCPGADSSPRWVFIVENTTPYTWNSYRFEFPMGSLSTLGITTSQISLINPGGVTITGDTISITRQSLAPTGFLQVIILPTFTNVLAGDTFTVRQIATTSTTSISIPEPSSLLGLGLLGLGAFVSRKRKG